MHALVVAPLLLSLVGAPAEEHLDLERLVELAKAQHPRLGEARAVARAREAEAKSARGRLLPAISLHDELQHYTSPFDISFGGGAFQARGQDTNLFVASATQPLLGLGARIERYRAAEAGAGASTERLSSAAAALTENLRIAYLELFEARALEGIAAASKAELEEQRAVAEAKVKAGALTRADRLRVEVAAANAEQQRIEAGASVATARAQLLTAVGLSPEAPVAFEEPTALLTRGEVPPPIYDAAQAQALEARPELSALEGERAAAEHKSDAAWWDLLPEVDVEAAYVRTDGQSFAPKDQAYVGLAANWRVFEWGAGWYAREASEAAAEAATASLEAAHRALYAELAQRLARLRASQGAVAVAQTAIASAEEAFRVTREAVGVGAATTTDLLDAESALTQARLRLFHARYAAAIARVQLDRAMGVD